MDRRGQIFHHPARRHITVITVFTSPLKREWNMENAYSIVDEKIIIDYSSLYCDTAQKLLRSIVFEDIVGRYLDKLAKKESPIYEHIQKSLKGDIQTNMLTVLRLLHTHTADEVIEINEKFYVLLEDTEYIFEFVEGLYNYWRSFERYIILSAPETRLQTRKSIHHAQFIMANETLRQLVLQVYRVVCDNLLDVPFRVYRQLPAGAHVGFMNQFVDWQCPESCRFLKNIPFIRLALLEPPVIFYPKMNVRKGIFQEVGQNPLQFANIETDEWFCYPAKIGQLLAFAYFHKAYMSQGSGLLNLFELANFEDIHDRKPDIILIFGANPVPITKELTMFHEDKENDILIGYEVQSPEIDYFGYMKKMLLTLHNIIMLKRGLLPVHGAMVSIRLKSRVAANVVIIGDSGAGKSETLEALRLLAADYINDMTIIFDDMGSIIQKGDRFIGYGTEIGAFLRLDDFHQGYAFEQMDRSIFMNPNLINARVIMPVTTFKDITQGVPIDYFFYANNYEPVDKDHPEIEIFSNAETALEVFNSGKRLAKGTTSEKGLVESYFANPFGAPQRRKLHEKIARDVFENMFRHNVPVGQIRTQLGIKGFEQEGPLIAAKALFQTMTNRRG
jgi:hypothetical protein